MFQKKMIVCFIFILIGALLISPNLCIAAASSGLLLWFNKVLPSLLPFIILINLLVSLQIMAPISRFASPFTKKIWHLPGSTFFAFSMGLIAGYPMGGKIIKELIEKQLISPSQGEKTLCFCNNCGPLFIIGTVGTVLLGNTQLGYFLFVIHLLSAFLMSFVLKNYGYSMVRGSTTNLSHSPAPFNFAKAFNEAVQNGMDTIVCVGGYIIFFSVVTKLLVNSPLFSLLLKAPFADKLPPNALQGITIGFLELSNGVGALSQDLTHPMYTLALLSFTLGFGGLCVYFQTLYVLGNTPISTTPYLICKFLQGMISFLLTCTLYPLFSMYTQKTFVPYSFIWPLLLIIFLILIFYSVTFFNQHASLKLYVHKKI